MPFIYFECSIYKIRQVGKPETPLHVNLINQMKDINTSLQTFQLTQP